MATATCFSGYGDCGQPAPPVADDGCETDLDNDVANCGSCGNTCPAGWACSFGMCLEP